MLIGQYFHPYRLERISEALKKYYYRARSKGDNTFGSVCPFVCLSVCLHSTVCACCGVVDIWAQRAKC